MRVRSSTGFSEAEIKRLTEEAEVSADQAEQVRRRLEAYNELEALLYTIEKSLTDYHDETLTASATRVKAIVQEGKKALEGTELQGIIAKIEELKQYLVVVKKRLP